MTGHQILYLAQTERVKKRQLLDLLTNYNLL